MLAHLEHSGPQLTALQCWKSADAIATTVRYRRLLSWGDDWAQLDLEIPNVLLSMGWLRTQANEECASLLLAYLAQLLPYLQARSRTAEVLYWCDEGRKAAARCGRSPAFLFLAEGQAAFASGNWAQAGQSWQAAASASSEREPLAHAQALLALGRLEMNQGEYRRGRRTLSEAEQLFRSLGNAEGLSDVRSELAAYHLNRRELSRALAMYLEVHQRETEDGRHEASDHSLLMLGVVNRQMGNFPEALEHLSGLYERAQARRDRSTLATAAHHIAWIHLQSAELEEARRLCGQAIALYEDIADPRGLSDCYEQLGAIHLELGQLDRALRHLARSEDMRRGLGNEPGRASSLRRMALVHIHQSRYGEALMLMAKAAYLYWRQGMLSWQRLKVLSGDAALALRKARARLAPGP